MPLLLLKHTMHGHLLLSPGTVTAPYALQQLHIEDVARSTYAGYSAMSRAPARLVVAGFGANAAAAHCCCIGATWSWKGIPNVFIPFRLQLGSVVYHHMVLRIVGRAHQEKQRHEQQQAKHTAFRLQLKWGLHSQLAHHLHCHLHLTRIWLKRPPTPTTQY